MTAVTEAPPVHTSVWGPDDEAGALNHVTPAKVRASVSTFPAQAIAPTLDLTRV